MTATEAKQVLEDHDMTVETMHVAVGNIYRCQELDGWSWMYEADFIKKVEQYVHDQTHFTEGISI